MINQILGYMKKVGRPVDICEACEAVRQLWTVTTYGLNTLVSAGLVETLPAAHPTYQLTAKGLVV